MAVSFANGLFECINAVFLFYSSEYKRVVGGVEMEIKIKIMSKWYFHMLTLVKLNSPFLRWLFFFILFNARIPSTISSFKWQKYIYLYVNRFFQDYALLLSNEFNNSVHSTIDCTLHAFLLEHCLEHCICTTTMTNIRPCRDSNTVPLRVSSHNRTKWAIGAGQIWPSWGTKS